VPPGDSDALAAILLRLASDRGEVARLGRQARQLAGEQFIPEQIVLPLIQELVTDRGTAIAAQS